jgi:cytoskeletal protein CcmA (bactofilin family)
MQFVEVPVKAVPPNKTAVLAADIVFQGNIQSEGDIELDGVIDGNVACRVLMIGRTGAVNGNIVAREVTVHGEVSGSIISHSVRLGASGKVMGALSYESLTVERGAYLDASCSMLQGKLESLRIPERPTALASGAILS